METGKSLCGAELNHNLNDGSTATVGSEILRERKQCEIRLLYRGFTRSTFDWLQSVHLQYFFASKVSDPILRGQP